MRGQRARRGEKAAAGPVAAGVVLAGGSGTRVGADVNKAFLPLAGRTLAGWSLAALAASPRVGSLVFVTRGEDQQTARDILAHELPGIEIEYVLGGSTRQGSELAALRHLAPQIDAGAVDVVLMHDAARPLVSTDLVEAVLRAARTSGGAIPALPVEGVVEVRDGVLVRPEAGGGQGQLLRVQTPQGFAAAPLLDAYERAAREDFVGTDTASCAERYTDLTVEWLRGEETNFKVTYAQDLLLAQDVVAALGLGPDRPLRGVSA